VGREAGSAGVGELHGSAARSAAGSATAGRASIVGEEEAATVGCLVTEIYNGGEKIDDRGMFELLNYV
jgi:hypothetical protein